VSHPDPEAAKAAAAAAVAEAIADATEAGYRPLTIPYFRTEAWMMNAVERDLQLGRIPYRLIEVAPGQTEVWRRGGVERPDPTRSLVKIKGERK
jgi:hypothetical protein